MGSFGNSINEYEVHDLLGKGGFAAVYRARCTRTGLEVAIKMIDKNLMKAAGMVARVRQEVSIHSRLKHPSILELYTFFEDDHYVYLVLELCHNGEVQRFLKRSNSVMSEDDACTILSQVVEGLLYLHSHQIVHRDISLANLLLTRDMNVKIADFGLATQLMRPDEKHLTMCGTPNYISPEVATRGAHGLETDVWGLGVLMYSILVGKAPFDAEDGIKSTLTRVVMAEVKYPPYLSIEARDLIKSLLRKNPNERIKLQAILEHPFMRKFRQNSITSGINNNPVFSKGCKWVSCDSGMASASYPWNPAVTTNSAPGSTYGCSHNWKCCEQCSHHDGCTCLSTRKPSFASGQHSNSSLKHNEYITANIVHRSLNTSGIVNHSHHSHVSQNRDFAHEISSQVPVKPVNHEVEIPKKVVPVPPLLSKRLRPVRQKTKNVVVNILENGEVCLEFLKNRDGTEKVYDVLRISPDGMRIILYQPNRGKGQLVGSEPPILPEQGADAIYNYDNLPEKHWKKYCYASRFVDLVKSKTPKITYYSSSAKCFYMENGPDADFEACFYEGGKITKSSGLVKLEEPSGHHSTFHMTDTPPMSPTPQLMWEHFRKSYKHCEALESSLSDLGNRTDDACFPIIVGRRPPNLALRTLYSQQIPSNKENVSPPSAIRVPTIGGYETSVASTRAGSGLGKTRKILKTTSIAGIGRVSQLSTGDIEVNYEDGNRLVFNSSSAKVSYMTHAGQSFHYQQSDSIPSEIRTKLGQMPHIVKALMDCR
ncbi:unnamed protein product [Allacma fusca]|uniref:Serine/threonine-protein kinase PLK4 n=1 Tax=Allacma fusca TaxID=39272 RepID=A0A8J2JW52_9HEXA|nr:unnamed protein product [Allacma fusca]